jgi:hypothetical protein
MLNRVRVWTETGETWMTSFNGSQDDASRYFLGNTFNIGPKGEQEDYLVKVVKVAWWEGSITSLGEFGHCDQCASPLNSDHQCDNPRCECN